MIRIILMLCVLGTVQIMAASSYGIWELGIPNAEFGAKGIALGGSGAAILDESHSLSNPAKTAFNTRTSFMLSMAFQTTEYGTTKENSFNIPYISMDIPIGFLGNVGIAYFQKYTNDFHFLSETEMDTVGLDVEGSYSEIVPSWSITFLDRFAIGINYHLPFGLQAIEENMLEAVTEKEVRYSGDAQLGLAAISAQYSGKGWSVFLGYQPTHTITQEIQEMNTLKTDDSDTTGGWLSQGLNTISKNSISQDMPWEINGGAAYKIGSHHQLAVDGSFQSWDGITLANPITVDSASQYISANNAYSIGLGYELTPSFRAYDLYLKRIAYRCGINYSQLYVSETKEINGSVGFGLPLGVRRVSTLDVTFQMGVRGLGAKDPEYQEYTMGLYVSFTGFGDWGKSSRRYR